MKQIIIIFIASILLFSKGFGQNSVKGYKSLEKGELDKAIESFTKFLKEDSTSCVANFGMAVVYSSDDNINHDLFKAWDFFVKANQNFEKLTPEENDFLKQYFGNRDTHRRNRTNKYNFDFEKKLIEDKLIKFVREENNIDVVEHFIKVYPTSKYYENVIHIRNHIMFRIAEKENTLSAYENFIKKYPNAAQIPKALKACQNLSFEIAKKKNTILSYNEYMKAYPDADRYFEALKLRDQMAFDQAKKVNTIEALNEFIALYPKALQLMSARNIVRQLLYEKARSLNTPEAYNEYINNYPEGEYFVDIFNLKANILGQKMVSQFQGDKGMIVWARGFDFEDHNDNAGGIVVTSDGKPIVCGTRQKSGEDGTQAWVIGMDNSGKVLWNKSYGTNTYNQSNGLLITPDKNLLLTGWSGNNTDSSFRKAWLFKITETGNGLWEKKIDGNEIKDFVSTPEGDIYLAGYQSDDSLKIKTFLLKLSSDAKKQWSRQYLKEGSIRGVTQNAKSEIICSSGRWLWKSDKQGYLLWEKTLNQGDSIFTAGIVNNQVFFNGSRNGTPLILKQNDIGMPAGEITSTNQDSAYVVTSFSLPGKRLFTLNCLKHDLKINILDEQGKLTNSLLMLNCRVNGPGSVYTNQIGEVYLSFTILNDLDKGDIGVVKFSY